MRCIETEGRSRAEGPSEYDEEKAQYSTKYATRIFKLAAYYINFNP